MQGIQSLNNSHMLNSILSTQNCQPQLPSFEKALKSAALEQAELSEPFTNAEQHLKDLYPGLKYQTLDASQFTYFNRLDFPTSKLYGDTIGADTINSLKSWKPGTQASNGFEPWVQRELEKIPVGAHVVLIHPDVQKKMEHDSEYAKKIAAKIQTYFDDDIRLNAAIDPESVKSMSQLVSITKDGEIGFHETVCDGPSSKENHDSQKDIASTQGKEKKPKATRKVQRTSVPLANTSCSASIQYDYRYAYQVFGLSQIQSLKAVKYGK